MKATPSDETHLRAVLEVLPAAIAIFDGAGLLRYANLAFWDQAGLGAAPLPPGTSVAEVAARLAAAGHFGEAGPSALHSARPHRQLLRSAGGHWHEVTSAPLPDGGSVLLSVDITGVRRSESEAVEHAALLEAILERLDTGISVTDDAGRLTYFNRAYERLIGAGAGGVRLGMTRAALFERLRQVGELDRMAPQDLANLPLMGVRGTSVFRRERPDGSTLWIRARPVPEGGVLTEVGDVTALRQAEQEAQDRAKLLDGVLSALPHGVCVYGPDDRVRMVNEAYQCIMVGAEIAVGENMRDIAARRIAQGEYGPRGEDSLPLLVADGVVVPELIERTRRRPNGTIVTVRLVPLPDGGQVVVMTDVTALTHAEEQAERRAATLRAMLDNQPDGVALFDAQANLIAANALAARMAGLSEDQMRPGRNLLELRALQVTAREFGPDAKDAQVFVESRGIRLLETRNRYVRRRPDGTLLEVRTDLTRDGGFIRTYRDVTEERRVRAELEAARDAAETASRTKSGFLATMTHELRTPLHVVIGFSEAILEESRPELIRAHAEEVLAAGRQLLGLVDGLLEATRIEAGTLSLRELVFDPTTVLRAAGMARRIAAEEAGIDLRLELPEALPPMRGDAGRLRQVLDALLSNALKFTPRGGQVTLAAAPSEGGGSLVTLSDTGIGMAPENIPRAFEAFTQLEAGLSRRYPGSGLGLYLARALTEAMGIRLALDSTPGQGTTATLAVPPADEVTA